MISISKNVEIPESEVEFAPIRASGPGGQNVNKVSSAVHLRFDIENSSLPDFYKSRLRNLKDRRISRDKVLVIKAARFRTQEKNRADAIERMVELIRSASAVQKSRRPTKPTKASKKRRLEGKTKRSKTKSLRRAVRDFD